MLCLRSPDLDWWSNHGSPNQKTISIRLSRARLSDLEADITEASNNGGTP